MDKFLVKKVKKKDSKRVWEIRNQPISRKYSNNPEEIPYEKHVPWFAKKYFSGEDNYCFVLKNEDSLVIGYCRLDFVDKSNHYVISIALDADFHRKGLGYYFLNQVLQQFCEEKKIFAEIQKNNFSSIKLFQNNKFKIYKEDKKNYYLKYLPEQNMKKEKLAILGGKPILSKPFSLYNSLGAEEKKAVARVMDKKIISDFIGRAGDKFLGGEYVKKFEKDFCRKFGVKYAVSFSSASTALQAAVAALGIGPGDEVITSPFTMSATASAILFNNAIPVFADIDPENYCLDVESIKKKITKRTKAILTVNIFGGSSDFSKIIPLAKKHNLKIIEDNAQSMGAKYEEKYLGTIGDIGVFSFNVHKHLQCGEGGVLITNDEKLVFRAQLVRNHGEVIVDDLSGEGIQESIIGSNYRLSELHAAVAIEQLKKINKLNNPRVNLAKYLTSQLKKFSWLAPCKILENSTHTFYVYPIKFFAGKIGIKRETFTKAMAAEGFVLGQGYLKPLYLMPIYQKREIYPARKFPFVSEEFGTNAKYCKGDCPVAERMFEKELLITSICNSQRTKADIDLFVKAIKKIEENIEELKKYEPR